MSEPQSQPAPETRACPICAETIQSEALKCRHCAALLIHPEWQRFSAAYAQLDVRGQAAEFAKLSLPDQALFQRIWPVWEAHQSQQPQAVASPQEPPSNAGPVIVNFFIPGLGQLVQGRVMPGLFWLLGSVVGVVTLPIFIGVLILPCVWLGSMVEAALWRAR